MNTPENRYQVIETLGTGATSRVDKARDTLIGRTVALKSFLHGFGSRDLEQQFLREAQIIGGLSHPNIVALYDVGTSKDGAPYLVMEYIEGKTLESVFEAGPLPLARLAAWAGDLATALGQAHRAKIIHGDVKPANILVTCEQQVKLGDFGIAHFATQASGSGEVMGTPAYLSPEQILGNTRDSRSDLFSLGIVIYQMATGVRPFNGDSVGAVCGQIISSSPPPPSHHNAALPTAFDQIVMRCLSKEPADRYTTAEALAASLYPFARSAGDSLPRANIAARRRDNLSWWNQPFRQKDGWTVAAALLVLLSAGWTVAALRKHAPPNLIVSATGDGPAAADKTPGSMSSPVISSRVSITSSALSDSPLIDSPSLKVASEAPLSLGPKPSASKVSNGTRIQAARHHASAVSRESAHDTKLPEAPAAAPSLNTPSSAPKPLASLRVEIVSAIAEGTLAVYAGQDVLLTTRLESSKLGEPLHFDCSLSPGAHPLRVVLYRADESLHIQKEGFAEIVADGSNTLDIRVNRHSRLLLRKDAALEVVWPNMHSTAARGSSPLESAASLSK
jgi:serine/threonine protein kinase